MRRFIITTLFALGAGATAPSFALSFADHVGETAAANAAARTVEISAGTRYLNVNSGEIVNLQFNGHTITWNFNGIDAVLKLTEIIPGAPQVNVYVARANNRYAP